MYTRLSRRLCQAFVSASYSRRNRPIFRRFLEITFNRPSAGNSTRTLYFSNIPYRETNSATWCENEMALKVDYEQLLKDQKDPNVLIVDVRELDEIKNTGALPESINIPLNDVEKELVHLSEKKFQEKYKKSKPAKDTKIIFSCRSGKRAACAQEIMQKLRYTQVYNYEGSWSDWEKRTAEKKEQSKKSEEEQK